MTDSDNTIYKEKTHHISLIFFTSLMLIIERKSRQKQRNKISKSNRKIVEIELKLIPMTHVHV